MTDYGRLNDIQGIDAFATFIAQKFSEIASWQ